MGHSTQRYWKYWTLIIGTKEHYGWFLPLRTTSPTVEPVKGLYKQYMEKNIFATWRIINCGVLVDAARVERTSQWGSRVALPVIFCQYAPYTGSVSTLLTRPLHNEMSHTRVKGSLVTLTQLWTLVNVEIWHHRLCKLLSWWCQWGRSTVVLLYSPTILGASLPPHRDVYLLIRDCVPLVDIYCYYCKRKTFFFIRPLQKCQCANPSHRTTSH